jgi:RNA polymerase sigma-70 factor, ECF subfamily
MVSKEDNELVYEVIKGSISSFEVLIDRHQKTIFNLTLRMVGDVETAKDLTQDIFVKAFERMGSFNFKHKFFSWIYRIAVNESINWLNRNPKMDGLQAAEHLTDHDDISEQEERRSKLLYSGLQELPYEYRALLLLKYSNGLSYEKISEVNGISLKKVRSRLYMAREQLQKILVRNGFLENE